MKSKAKTGLKWSFFGSSLVSAYWNGAATYYRGIIRSLAHEGHRITFYEPDAYQRQQHRDIENPSWASVYVYPATREGLSRALEHAAHADILVKASGVGVFDTELEADIVALRESGNRIIFWDVDAPATLTRMQNNPLDPFRSVVPKYDLILTYGGGQPVTRNYKSFGAQECIPVYNALDPHTHFRVEPESRFTGMLGFLGNRLPDREKRVEDYFFATVNRFPESRFLLGGNGWDSKPLRQNIRYLGHVFTHQHNAFNSSTRAVLNICRESMAEYGFCPPTRIFEAAGARACIVSDGWQGIELFLTPGEEILVANQPGEVIEALEGLGEPKARRIGEAAFRRITHQHTYKQRATQILSILDELL